MNNERISRGGRAMAGFSVGVGATSYEDAIDATASHVEQTDEYGHAGGADLTDNQLTAPIASVLPACRVPDNMKVVIKVAVKHGRAVGVTVDTDPVSERISSCVDRAVRAIRWPSSPRLDSFTTSY